jgi:hypothetical protein
LYTKITQVRIVDEAGKLPLQEAFTLRKSKNFYIGKNYFYNGKFFKNLISGDNKRLKLP